jgi:aminopeptidase N
VERLVALMLIALMVGACSQTKRTTSEYSLKSGGLMPISQQGLVVKHAELGFKIRPAQQILEGEVTLNLVSEEPRQLFSVDLDRVFTISEVRVNGIIIDAIKYSNPEGMLLVNQPVSGEFTLTVKYRVQPRIPENAPWNDGLMWEVTPSGEPWIATAVQGGGCDIFWPCIDHPVGEPAKVDLYINVPKPLVAASNGVLINVSDEGDSKTYHWQTKSMHNTYGIALNIAPYELLEAKFNSIYENTLDIQFYHLPERKEQAELFNVDPLLIIFCVNYKRYLKQQNFITLSLIDIRYERVRLCLLLVLSGIIKIICTLISGVHLSTL